MNLLGKAMDKEFWKEVREKDCYKKYREELFDIWSKHCENVPIYALKYTDFRMFVRTGNRSIYEKTYFTRRLAMDCSALLALIYPEEEKYLVRLMDEIYSICDEYTWCLPAHQTKLEVNNNIHIDLFAAETGFALSEIYTLLNDRLEPLILDRIRVEIDRRILTAYTNGTHYWWETGTNNWTAVCMGSVGCTMMLMHPELVPELKPRFDASMERYLLGFNDDGMCLEGCGYWHYGFGFFTVYADMIRKFTNGETDSFKREKVKTIATFIQKMFLSGKSSVSFADGGRNLSYHLGLVHYLKDEYPDDVLVYSPDFSYNYDTCGRFCLQLRSATWLNEDYFYNPADDNVASETYAVDSQWFVKRTSNYGFAAKGGCNGEHHNHNDVGTFIFAKDGHQIIMDLGSGAYTRQYFANDTRYTILECSSRGHNVPIINGKYQGAGGNYKSKGTKYENGVFYTEMSGAYAIEGLNAIERTFKFTDDSVMLNDKFDYAGEGKIVERFVSLYKPEVCDGCVKVDSACISFDKSVCKVEISSEPVSKGGVCYLIDFTLNDGVKDFEIVIK